MKILIIRPAALGDTLMLTPALDQLRHRVSLRLVGQMPGLEYLRPFADRCIDFERAGWHSLFSGTPEVAGLPDADLAVAFLKDPDGIVERNLRTLLPKAGVYLFHGLPAPEEDVHVALHLARCLQAAGADVVPARVLREALNRPLIPGGGLYGGESRIVLHPGSGSREKNHPPEFWMEVGSRLGIDASFRNMEFTVLLGPAEEGLIPFFEKHAGRLNSKILFSPGQEDLISLLKGAALYLGQDSGVTHLAALLGAPTLALFRNSSVAQWRPLGPKVRIIRHPEPGTELVSWVLEEARYFREMSHEGL